MKMIPCPVCERKSARDVAGLDATVVLQCQGCSFLYCADLPSIESPSTGSNSVLTSEAYTAGMMAVSDHRQQLYRELARSRYSEYSRRLGHKNFRLLEIGCGSAGMAEQFQELGVEYLGMDIDERPVQAALSRGVAGVRVADFLAVDVEAPFDVITASQVLEHITKPRLFVEKIAHSLRPGGIVHLDVPYHYSLAGWMSRFALRHRNRWGGIEWPHHVFAYTKTSLNSLLSNHFDHELRTAACDDPLWGQAYEPRLITKLYYRMSATFGAPSILAAVGRRK